MASKNPVMIRELHTNHNSCSITVRIIRLWKQPVYGNVNNIGSIEMIIMDAAGQRIQASVRKNVIPTFEKLLVEGGAICMNVIGKVSGYGDVIIGDKNGSPNQMMDVQLQDIVGNKMKVTFWDSYVDDFKAKFNNDKAAVNVMIVQFAKLREWRGIFSVSHGFNVARIFMNNNIDEINAFKKRQHHVLRLQQFTPSKPTSLGTTLHAANVARR
uniref:uncharacterized protein LOC122587831 n=1 Tax=Erigeron canadensis TaxID=72917 RepID=UPI001CB94B74|nr:uncharacterized protein LOC122587831 [Erigeron canadensis]